MSKFYKIVLFLLLVLLLELVFIENRPELRKRADYIRFPAIHPGSNCSTNCIMMKNPDAAELYEMVSLGTKVIIYGGPYGCLGENFRTIIPG